MRSLRHNRIDPVTLQYINDIRNAYYLEPNVHAGRISTVYSYNTLQRLLKMGRGMARSPLTRRPFTSKNVRPVVAHMTARAVRQNSPERHDQAIMRRYAGQGLGKAHASSKYLSQQVRGLNARLRSLNKRRV